MPEKHKRIEARLHKANQEAGVAKKILLLGSGECGKSTILKQMKILHTTEPFTAEERTRYKHLVYNNTITGIQSLVQGCRDLRISFSTPDYVDLVTRIMQLEPDSVPSLDVKDDLKEMWKDSGIQLAATQGSKFHMLDSAPYFLNNLDRTFSADYKPTEQDILRTRLMTTGIIETTFSMKNHMFKMYDVGGQRGERKRWIHAFDDVTAIMFIASLSEYDQTLAEDNTINRLDESLDLFEGISNLPWFSKAAIFLFLNKKDLFQEKIKHTPIEAFQPEFSGWVYDDGSRTIPWEENSDEENYDEGVKFITDVFKDRLDWDDQEGRKLYTFQCDATNTNHVELIWKATKHAILSDMLTKSELQMA